MTGALMSGCRVSRPCRPVLVLVVALALAACEVSDDEATVDGEAGSDEPAEGGAPDDGTGGDPEAGDGELTEDREPLEPAEAALPTTPSRWICR
jgi:hypothetical protein